MGCISVNIERLTIPHEQILKGHHDKLMVIISVLQKTTLTLMYNLVNGPNLSTILKQQCLLGLYFIFLTGLPVLNCSGLVGDH